jgi:4-carboxymuconolactone decarboxylase
MNDIDKRSHDERHAAGLQTRREVIGQELTNQRMALMNDFNRPLQELLNTYCFNDIWNRPGLPRQTRSMLNIAMLCALNRGPELQTHLAGALNNGVSKSEIQEVLLQVAVYCGVPAAVEGFRAAQSVFDERGV